MNKNKHETIPSYLTLFNGVFLDGFYLVGLMLSKISIQLNYNVQILFKNIFIPRDRNEHAKERKFSIQPALNICVQFLNCKSLLRALKEKSINFTQTSHYQASQCSVLYVLNLNWRREQNVTNITTLKYQPYH